MRYSPRNRSSAAGLPKKGGGIPQKSRERRPEMEGTEGKERRRVYAGADWAAKLSGTCQVGQLVRRPGGLPRQMQTSYPVTGAGQ